MLKITVQRRAKETTMKLEGRLAGPWVEELNRTWESLAPSLKSKKVCVDLCEVTFVDSEGKRLLRTLWKNGVRFAADTPLIKHVVEEIEQSQ